MHVLWEAPHLTWNLPVHRSWWLGPKSDGDMHQLTPPNEQINSEENFTAYRLYNFPLSTVKKCLHVLHFNLHQPISLSLPFKASWQPTSQGSFPKHTTHVPSQLLPVQFQVICSPIHVVHSQPISSSLGPVGSQPLTSQVLDPLLLPMQVPLCLPLAITFILSI